MAEEDFILIRDSDVQTISIPNDTVIGGDIIERQVVSLINSTTMLLGQKEVFVVASAPQGPPGATPNSRYKALTAAYTVQPDDGTINCVGTFTITLPNAASVPNNKYNLKNGGVGIITVNSVGGQLIDADVTWDIVNQYDSMTIQSTGSGWVII